MMHPPQCGMVTCNCSALVAHTRCGAASALGVTETRFVRLAGPRRAVLLPQAMLFSEEGPVFQQASLGYGHAAATLTSEELYFLARGLAGRVGPLSAIGSHDGSRDRDAYFRPVSVAVVRALV